MDADTAEIQDVLAELFLGPVEARARRDRRTGTDSAVALSSGRATTGAEGGGADDRLAPGLLLEAVVLGNLPGLASLWPARYARHLAHESDAPVALVRADGQRATVQLVGPCAPPECTSAERAMAHALAAAKRVVVVVSNPEDESRLLADPKVSVVTLLTGADDASAVGAYRTLRRLSSSVGALRDGAPAPELRVGIMGATDERAQSAWDRLRESARSFLEANVGLAACIARLEGGATVHELYDGLCERTCADLLDVPPEAPRPRLKLAVEHRPARVVDAVIDLDDHAQMDDADEAPDTDGQGFHERIKPADEAPGERVEAIEDLTSIVPGHSVLPWHCPEAPDVQLAVNDQGAPMLQALACEGVDPQGAVYRLVVAGAWAWTHRELLASASEGRLSTGVRPVLHLVTDQPKAVRGLLHSDVRVHALAPGQALEHVIELN